MKLQGRSSTGVVSRSLSLDTNALREYVTLQSMTADGTWAADDTLWASIDDLGVPGVLTDKATHRVYIRALSGVTTSKRLLWDTTELYIVKRRDIHARDRWLELECSEARLANWVVENGKTVTITTYSTDTYDPNTGDVTQVEVDHTPRVSGPEPFETNTIDGELIIAGDAKIMIPEEQISFVPTPGLSVTVDSDVWKIISVRKHYLGEYVDAYTCQLRA